MRIKPWLLTFFILAVFCTTQAQSISSTYSSNGIGDLNPEGLQQNFSMGELGYAVPQSFQINLQNPSLLNYNGFSSFAVGLMGDFRKYQTETLEDNGSALSLRYLAMSFPLARTRWATAISLLPYSSVKYDSYSLDSLNQDTNSITQYQGNGGLSSLSWSHGIRLYKSLSIGVKASFIFGSIEKNSRTQLLGTGVSNAYAISYNENTAYKDVNFSFSFSNRVRLGARKFINFGGVYQLPGDLNGNKERLYERYSAAGALLQTRTIGNEDIIYSTPSSLGLGLTYQNINKIIFGGDIKLEQWGDGAGLENDGRLLENTLSFSLGGEMTPDIQNVNNYLKRTTYRVGFQYKELPYRVEGTQINDFGINFGISLPVSGYSTLEAAIKYGVRGTTALETNLVKESYIQVVIGATFNDGWFIKQKFY